MAWRKGSAFHFRQIPLDEAFLAFLIFQQYLLVLTKHFSTNMGGVLPLESDEVSAAIHRQTAFKANA